MAEVHTIDIDGEQWNILDQEAKAKNNAQDEEIKNLTSDINLIKNSYGRFYYDANTDRKALQNRIDAMLYCYNNSKSSIATIRYKSGYYYQAILPAVELGIKPLFIEITYSGDINIFHIKNSSEYEVVKSI